MEHEFLNYGGMEREPNYKLINVKEDVLKDRLINSKPAICPDSLGLQRVRRMNQPLFRI